MRPKCTKRVNSAWINVIKNTICDDEAYVVKGGLYAYGNFEFNIYSIRAFSKLQMSSPVSYHHEYSFHISMQLSIWWLYPPKSSSHPHINLISLICSTVGTILMLHRPCYNLVPFVLLQNLSSSFTHQPVVTVCFKKDKHLVNAKLDLFWVPIIRWTKLTSAWTFFWPFLWVADGPWSKCYV